MYIEFVFLFIKCILYLTSNTYHHHWVITPKNGLIFYNGIGARYYNEKKVTSLSYDREEEAVLKVRSEPKVLDSRLECLYGVVEVEGERISIEVKEINFILCLSIQCITIRINMTNK